MVIKCNSSERSSISETLNGASAINELRTVSAASDLIDPVCASVHCALAPYWGKKLGKQTMTAFMASPRSGTLYLEWDEEAQRVRICGEAVTVMVGTLLV
uniref:Uncharacterized protein n=1 Tax=Arundo donax TaxID=35708 RepID=A0A0A9GXK1_ARUDO